MRSMDEDQEYYEWSLTPKNASEENKTGVSIKGRDTEYINAHGKIVNLFKKKGDKFILNGNELYIADKQKNKPINIEIKSKKGFTGKVNLKIYDVNNRGGATMLITMPSGGDLSYAKLLAFDVIKYLLDNIISGNIRDEDIAGFRVKATQKEMKNQCMICEKVFTTENRLKIHISKLHTGNGAKCDDCGEEFQTQDQLELHVKSKHSIEKSPEAKKLRITEDNHDDENESDMEVDVQTKEKDILSKLRDEKVLQKQRSIDKEVELMQEMKKRKEILKEEEEKKRKRQMSTDKKRLIKKNKKENSVSKELSINTVKVKSKNDNLENVKEKEDIGPGYMGHSNGDQKEARSLSYEDLCQAYVDLSQEYRELKEKYDKLNDSKDNEELKNIRKLTQEMRILKNEYKECVDALKKETHDKVKAETTAKVLKDIIESQEEIKESKKMETASESEMDIDEGISEWVQQQKRKPIKFQKRKTDTYKSKSCGENVNKKENLKSHDENHRNNSTYCNDCDEIFVEKNDYVNHQKKHKERSSIKCDVCEKIFYTNSDLIQHVKLHKSKHEKHDFNCNKCGKEYSDMNKLRRHDWRGHRSIPCNICGEEIQSRSDIGEHRKNKHGINKIAICKFYPNCLDQDECFFIHEEGNQNEQKESLEVCPNGENCTDQSCGFSEWKHKTSTVLCKFQQNCNRLNCPFKHTIARKAFLGGSISSLKEK